MDEAERAATYKRLLAERNQRIGDSLAKSAREIRAQYRAEFGDETSDEELDEMMQEAFNNAFAPLWGAY